MLLWLVGMAGTLCGSAPPTCIVLHLLKSNDLEHHQQSVGRRGKQLHQEFLLGFSLQLLHLALDQYVMVDCYVHTV
jgi:hypothetical protein